MGRNWILNYIEQIIQLYSSGKMSYFNLVCLTILLELNVPSKKKPTSKACLRSSPGGFLYLLFLSTGQTTPLYVQGTESLLSLRYNVNKSEILGMNLKKIVVTDF